VTGTSSNGRSTAEVISVADDGTGYGQLPLDYAILAFRRTGREGKVDVSVVNTLQGLGRDAWSQRLDGWLRKTLKDA